MDTEAVLFDPAKEPSTSYLDEIMWQRSKSWLVKHKARACSGDSNSPRLPRPDGSEFEDS